MKKTGIPKQNSAATTRKPAATPAAKSPAKSAAKSARTKLAAKPLAKPVVNSSAKAARNSKSKPAVNFPARPAAKPARTKPAAKDAAKPAAKPAAKVATQAIAKSSARAKASARPAASTLKTQRALRDRERATRRPSRTPGVEVLTAEALTAIPWLAHGFSTRTGGVTEEYGSHQLNLGFTEGDTPANVERNRKKFIAKVLLTNSKAATPSGKAFPLVLLNQVHSGVIHRVWGANPPAGARLTLRDVRRGIVFPTAGDGLITNARGILLGVKVADCYPVILSDRRKKAVGIFHAGWRGTVQRIVEKGVGEMRRHFGCRPQDLVAVIGPGIGSCCYEIGEEVESRFESQFAYAPTLFEDVFDSWSLKTKYPMLFLNQRAPGHGEPALSRHLDLVKANRQQLLDAGLAAENIHALGLCTSCRTDIFFSYRKERVTGRMLAVVGIR